MQMAKVVQLLGELARTTAVAANQPVVGGNKKYEAMTDITIITRRDDRYYASWHHNATVPPQSSYWSSSSPWYHLHNQQQDHNFSFVAPFAENYSYYQNRLIGLSSEK